MSKSSFCTHFMFACEIVSNTTKNILNMLAKSRNKWFREVWSNELLEIHEIASKRGWILIFQNLAATYSGGVQICSFFGYYNQNKEKHRKNTQRSEVNSSTITQYTFCLEIQNIYSKLTLLFRKSGFLWPLHFVYFLLTSHHIIGSSVTMSEKHRPWHCYSIPVRGVTYTSYLRNVTCRSY